MPTRNYPFSKTRPGDVPRPYLPIIIINPDTKKHLKIIALIDTGADECALPASFASILGQTYKLDKQKESTPEMV